jgi:hypothetical protein
MASPAGSAAADPARRSALLATKLAALVRQHLGGEPRLEPGPFTGGAALLERPNPGDDQGDRAWVLGDEQPTRALGQGLAWAHQAGATSLGLVVDDVAVAATLARRAPAFALPIEVFRAGGRTLVPVAAVPHPVAPVLDPVLLHFTSMIEEGGAQPLVERGVLVGEVRGLEVCRAVIDPATGAQRLEVGVGAHDREAFQLMHGDVPTMAALEGVVRAVAQHRTPGAERHPLQTLGAERWLRAELMDHPGRVGMASLGPADPPVPRANVKDPVPAVAIGEDTEGRSAVVVCSVGIDLDLVPFAADARLCSAQPHTRLVLVVPERDAHAVTHALAGLLVHPAEVVSVPWPPQP